MLGIAITAYSSIDTPAVLAITGHPAVRQVVLARDLGDVASHNAALRGVPCLILDFVSAEAADEALARLRAISEKLTYKETPTQIVCSNGVQYTLRLVHGFDEATIAAIDEHYDDAATRYAIAQREQPRPQPRHARR